MKKNFKKVLAVVLSVALALSVMAVASAASISDYSDASSITQAEAVNVLTYAGVLQGSDGMFNPTGLVTREQAAKIVCYLTLGSTAASQLTTTTSSFSDVSASRWSAPFIQYCALKGIINGMGDGTFNPEGNVTGAQFAKMLLTALGYGKNGEYVGANWSINVIADAITKGILTLGVDAGTAATREQVAQYAFNTLLMNFVTYNTTTSSYQATTVAPLTFASILGLTKTTNVVINGQTGHTWTYGTNAMYFAFYPDESTLFTSTSGMPISILTSNTSQYYKGYTLDPSFTMYLNGTQVSAEPTTTGTVVSAGSYYYDTSNNLVVCTTGGTIGTTTPVYASAIKAGDIVNFIDSTPYDGLNWINKISIIQQQVGVVSSVSSVANSGGSSVMTISMTVGSTTTTITKASSYLVGASNLAQYDVVTFYTDAYGITYFTQCTPSTGTYTGYDTYGDIYLNGTLIPVSGETGAATLSGSNYNSLAPGSTCTVYTDANGYAVYGTGSTVPATTNMAVMLAYGDVASSGVNTAYTQAKLLMPDGTTKIVTSNQTASALNTLLGGTMSSSAPYTSTTITNPIVTYAVDAYGNYTFTAVTNVSGTATITSGQPSFIDTSSVTQTASTATVYLIYNTTTGTYNEYTGYANIPTLSGASYVATTANTTQTGVDTIIYVSGYTASSLNANTVFFYNTAYTYTAPTSTGAGNDYNTYSAVVGTADSATSVKVVPTVTIGTAGVYSVSYDTLGRVASATLVSPSTGVTAATNGLVGIGSTFYAYESTAPVYIYNSTTNTLTSTTVGSIATNSSASVVALFDSSGAVSVVYEIVS